MNFRDFITEVMMTDKEIEEVCNMLISNGDKSAKEFAQGLLDYYKEHGSFHPNQVSGLQNIMKKASFQLADK